MDKAYKIASGFLIFIVLFGTYGFFKYITTPKYESPIDKASYRRVATKACVGEAVKGGVTEADATTYCNCALDKVYGNLSVEEMRKIDAEFAKSPGTLPEKYDAVVLVCADLIMGNYQ